MYVLLYILCALADIFSVLLLFKGGGVLSWLAMFLALTFTIALSVFSFFYTHKKKIERYFFVKKMLEYLPLLLVVFFVIAGVSASEFYWLDAFLAIDWVIITICTVILLMGMREKAMKKKYPALFKKEKKHKIVFGILDWIDAIAQAACIVLLLQFFVFQLYLIPSESMVPTFMIGDRVIGTKFTAGPTFPLSSFRFPQLKKYKRGDVVIVRNPNYEEEKNNDLKFFTSQLIQILTLTMLNINVDKEGKIKTDPLVKRVVGCPNEKLMLVDGKLYIKKAGEKDWKVQDESSYAVWNIEALPQSDLAYVKDKKINTKVLEMLESIETSRRNLDFHKAIKEAHDIVDEMVIAKAIPDTTVITEEIVKKDDLLIDNIVQRDLEITSKILTTNGALNWFTAFMTDWAEHWQKSDDDVTLYEKRFAQLNALIKISIGRLFVKDIQLLKENLSSNELLNNQERLNLLNELRGYYYYLALSGQRNMNEFPKGDGAYIPEQCFFMMGDNRFNSTDMRHGYKIYPTEVDKNDPLSIKYFTNMNPRYIHESRILGTANFIFWPRSRIGKVK